jgi:hypothetical protein
MTLRFLLDEHLRGPLWSMVSRHNLAGVDTLDVIRVGDPQDLPLGTSDPDLLLWAEREQLILVSEDRSTMARHLAAHLALGHHSPGVWILRPNAPYRQVLAFLVVAAYASGPAEWENRMVFIP